MTPETRAKLEAADCSVGWEVPLDDWETFPWKIYMVEIVSIQERIASELGVKLERDGNVQDASFLEQLSADDDTTHVFIRFSNFGKLYTFFVSGILDLDKLETLKVNDIKQIVNSFGWIFVPAEELQLIYDGKHKGFRKSGETWWIRFFDYV